MAYFPLFVELQGRRALIVGGGRGLRGCTGHFLGNSHT